MYPILIHSVDSAIYSTEWFPGRLNGVPVDTSIFIPIIFKLFDIENAPPLTIISARHQSRGRWEYLPIKIDTNLVQVPLKRPENFSFILKWWFYKDSLYLNTAEKFLKYRYGNVDTSINFILSDNELDSIYQVMRKIYFLCYPKDFSPGITGWSDPSFSFYCKMEVDDYENEISTQTGFLSNDPSFKKLKDFFWMIYSIIRNSTDYKKIRKPTHIYIYE